MKEIIWTKEELNRIKKIILNSANLNFDDENLELIKNKKNYHFSVFDKFQDDIENLLYIQDREQIRNCLEQISRIKADNNNPLHFGLILSLSKIDTTDDTQIFEVFKEIISQYMRASSSEAKELMGYINQEKNLSIRVKKIKIVIEKIKNDKHSPCVHNTKVKIRKTFQDANRIDKNQIFESLIKKLDNQIKDRIIDYFVKELTNQTKIEKAVKEKDYREHLKKNKERMLRKEKYRKGVTNFINK